MLNVVAHQDFKRDFKKLPQGIRTKFSERLLLFLKNPKHLFLKDHALKGDLHGRRSFSVTGDVRVIYRKLDQHTILLLRVGSHNQVY